MEKNSVILSEVEGTSGRRQPNVEQSAAYLPDSAVPPAAGRSFDCGYAATLRMTEL